MAKQKFSIRGILGININNFEANLKKAQKQVGSFKKTTDKMGSNANKMALPLIGGFAAIIKASGDFQQAMARVKAITKATPEDFKLLSDEAKKMGATTQYSAVQSAKALEFLGMAGIKAKDSIRMLPQVLSLATAANIELAESADVVSDVMTMFRMSASQTTSIIDDLATTTSSSNTDMAQLFEAFKNGGSVANTLGMSLKSTSIIMALFADASIKGSVAGTSLKQIIMGLTATTPEGEKAFKRLGISASDMTKKLRNGDITGFISEFQTKMSKFSKDDQISLSKAIFGKLGAPSFLGLINASQSRLEELTKTFKNNGGSAKKMADEGIGAFNKAMNTLKSTIEGLLIKLGESGLLSVITDLTKSLTEGVKYLGDHKEEIIKLGKATLVFITVIKAAQITMTAFNAVLNTNPYILASTAILSLGTALYTLSGSVDDVSESYKAYLSQVDTETSRLTILKDKLDDASISQEDRTKAIKEFNTLSGGYLKTLLTEKSTAKNISKAYDDVVSSIQNKIAIQAKENALTQSATKLQNTKAKAIGDVYDKVKDDSGSETKAKQAVEEFKKYVKAVQNGSMSVGDAYMKIGNKYSEGLDKFLVPRQSINSIIEAEKAYAGEIQRINTLYGEQDKILSKINDNKNGIYKDDSKPTSTPSSSTFTITPKITIDDDGFDDIIKDLTDKTNDKFEELTNKIKPIELKGMSSDKYETSLTDFNQSLSQAKNEYRNFGDSAKYADSVSSLFSERINLLSTDMVSNGDEVRKLIGVYNELQATTKSSSQATMDMYYNASNTWGAIDSGVSSIDGMSNAFDNLNQKQEQGNAGFMDYIKVITSVGSGILQLVGVVLTMAGVQKKASAGILSANATKGISAAIASAAMLPFPANIPAMATAQGVATAQFASVPGIANGIGAMAFKDGGVVSGATLSLTGEYAGARNNPELIAPANKMMKYIRKAVNESGGGNDQTIIVGGELRMDGDELIAYIRKEGRKNNMC